MAILTQHNKGLGRLTQYNTGLATQTQYNRGLAILTQHSTSLATHTQGLLDLHSTKAIHTLTHRPLTQPHRTHGGGREGGNQS